MKCNRRNSKERPSATVCAIIEQFLCSEKNSPWQMVGPRPPRPQAMLHPGTRIPNHALLSLSPAAPLLTMLSHLPDLLWLPLVIMTVKRPTQCWSRSSVSPERVRIMGNLRVIDLPILPPLVDLISYLVLQQTTVVSVIKAQIVLTFTATVFRAQSYFIIIIFNKSAVSAPHTL